MNVIRKEAWLFCRTSSGVRLCWELEEPKGPKGFIDNLLVRIHHITVMIKWTGLAPWEFEFPFPGSLTSTFLSGDSYADRESLILIFLKTRFMVFFLPLILPGVGVLRRIWWIHSTSLLFFITLNPRVE